MKLRVLVSTALAVALIAGCGGGGGEAGGPESLSLTIDERTIPYPDAGCTGPSRFLTVYISGGRAPFTLLDPYPGENILQFDLTNLSNRSFRFRHLSGCFDSIPIVLKDAAGNTAQILFTAEKQETVISPP